MRIGVFAVALALASLAGGVSLGNRVMGWTASWERAGGIMDPDGQPRPQGDAGGIMDPNGQPRSQGDEGGIMDPNG
jgi:hypothetical protein